MQFRSGRGNTRYADSVAGPRLEQYTCRLCLGDQRMTTLYAALFSRQDIIDNREPS